MRLSRLILLALIPCLSGSPASAQLAGPALDFFAGQIDREIARQKQRQLQRQQQQQHNQTWQIFLTAWKDCFDRNDLVGCEFALTYPHIIPEDYQRVLTKRAEIVAAIQAQQEAVRREQAERAAQERQRRIEAEQAERQRRIDAANEARRQQQEREQAAERLRHEQAREAARLRQHELDRQRAEAEQARRARMAEEKRLAEIQALTTALLGCQRFEPDSCDRALASPHANPDKLNTLREWRTIGVNYAGDRTACEGGAMDACDRALASRAVTDADRPRLNEWRIAASPVHRAIATLSIYGATAVETAQALPTIIRELPLSTQITGGVATMLALALAMVVVRRAPATAAPAAPVGQGASTPAPVAAATAAPSRPRRRPLRRKLWRGYVRLLHWRRWYASAKPVKDVPPKAVSAPAAAVAALQDRPRDTETAVDAMQLALAYIAEFTDDLGNALDDPAYAARVLNTLSLISRQIEIADRADPTAIVTIETDKGEEITHSVTTLKAAAIYYEAMCRMAADPKRSLRLLEQVLEHTPDAAHAYFWIGTLNADMLNKGAAVAAFEKAVALDPRNMDYRKELVRAQSISGSQIAYDRAATGVRTTVSIAKWLWFGFWASAIFSFVAAVVRGNALEAAGIFFVFMFFGAILRGINIVRSWFGANT